MDERRMEAEAMADMLWKQSHKTDKSPSTSSLPNAQPMTVQAHPERSPASPQISLSSLVRQPPGVEASETEAEWEYEEVIEDEEEVMHDAKQDDFDDNDSLALTGIDGVDEISELASIPEVQSMMGVPGSSSQDHEIGNEFDPYLVRPKGNTSSSSSSLSSTTAVASASGAGAQDLEAVMMDLKKDFEASPYCSLCGLGKSQSDTCIKNLTPCTSHPSLFARLLLFCRHRYIHRIYCTRSVSCRVGSSSQAAPLSSHILFSVSLDSS